MTGPFDVWITKYCLSAGGGIEQATAYQHPVNASAIIVASGRMRGAFLQNDQWHRTEREARTWAEALRKRTIEQDRKRLAELEALSFKTESGNADG